MGAPLALAQSAIQGPRVTFPPGAESTVLKGRAKP
jgi:hypothetical protein